MKPCFKNLPKKSNGRVDKDLLRKLFFESPHLHWKPFAKENGWSPESSYRKIPAAQWCAEKRAGIMADHQEKILNAVLNVRTHYEMEVIKTLKDLPPIVDGLIHIIVAKINSVLTNPNEKISIGEMRDLVTAFDRAVQTKHRALLMDSSAIELIRQDITNYTAEVDDPKKSSSENKFVFQVMGAKSLSGDEIKKMIEKYLDPALPAPANEGFDDLEDLDAPQGIG